MRCCWCATLLALSACGRLRFDAISSGDGSLGDVPGDSALPPRSAYIKASHSETFDDFGYAVALSGDGNTLAVGAPQEDSGSAIINGNELDNTVSAAGAVYVFVRTGTTWSQQAYLKTFNPSTIDFLGAALAFSHDGNTLVAGAPGEDSSSTGINSTPDEVATDAGAAYVFVRSGTTWSQQAYLKASNTDANDDFGFAVAISGTGDTIVIGADFEDSNATGVDGNPVDDSAANAGAAYVFTRSGTTWSEQTYLKASNTEADDQFGGAVALSADGLTLAITAPAEDGGAAGINGNEASNAQTSAGAIYVFTFTTTWSQQAYAKSPLPGFGDYFGRRIALSTNGDVLLAAGPGEDTIVANSGAAYLLTRSGATWSNAQKLKASNPGDSDQFSEALALSGDGGTLMIGAPSEDSAATGVDGDQTDDSGTNSGAMYVFGRVDAAWSQRAYAKANVHTNGDQFGYATALSADGRTAACGLPNEDSAADGIDGDATDESAQDSGAVIVTFY